MHPPAGILYTPVLLMLYFIATRVVPTSLSVALFVLAWIAQFVGHRVYEKRAPALLTNLHQALHAAVFFVWLELMFKGGLYPRLKEELDQKVKERLL